MAMVGNVIVRIGADIKPMQKGLKNAQANVSGFQKGINFAMQNASKGMNMNMGMIASSLSMGKAGLIAFSAAATVAMGVLAKKSISMAMDVVESESLFQVSMGNMADSARAWSNELQASLGLNAYEVRKNVGLFYNMTTSMGLAQDQAYKVSTGITKLAYDMSSFYNQSPEEMFTKLQAGLTGEIEPLRRLGVIVNETTTKNFAYANGIANVGAELTETQKVMARYGSIMAQTKNANGDLARTINSPTNQLRLLQAQLTLAQINLGNAFLPIVSIVLPILTGFAKSLAAVTNTFSQFMSVLFGTNKAQTQNAQSATSAAKAQNTLGTATKKAGAAAAKSVAGFDEVNQLQESIASNADDAAGALGDVASTSPTPTKTDSGSIIPQGILDAAQGFKNAMAPVVAYMDTIKKYFQSFWTDIQPTFMPIINFIKTIFTPVWEGLKTNIIIVMDVIKWVIKGALDMIEGLLKVFGGIVSGNWAMVWDGIKQIVSGAFTIIMSVVIGAGTILANFLKGWAAVMKSIWDVLWYSLHTLVKTVIDGIRDNVLIPFMSWISSVFSTVWGAVTTAFSTALNFIKNLVSTVFNAIKTSISSVMSWMTSTVPLGMTNIKDSIVGAFSTAANIVANIWEGMKATVKSGINWVVDKINGFIATVNGFKIEIPSVTIAGKTIGGGTISFPQIPTIPKLARGGIVNSPTIAQIGEAGPEMVVPLENTSFVDSIANAIGNAVMGAMQFSQPSKTQSGDTVISIDGTQLARVLFNPLQQETARRGNMAIVQPI